MAGPYEGTAGTRRQNEDGFEVEKRGVAAEALDNHSNDEEGRKRKCREYVECRISHKLGQEVGRIDHQHRIEEE